MRKHNTLSLNQTIFRISLRWAAAFGVLVCLGSSSLCLAQEAPFASAPTANAFAERFARPNIGRAPHRVLALYYPWYSTPAISGKWAQDGVDPARHVMSSHTHYPLSGPYDSSDPTVIESHLTQAKAAGIDTLVCSWWGRSDATDKAIRLLMEHAPAHGMMVCILWEQLARGHDEASASSDLKYLLQTFGEKPGALKLNGRPVVFLYQGVCQGLATEQWADVLVQTQKHFPGGFLAIGTGARLEDARLWDGLFSLEPAPVMPEQNTTESARALREASSASRLLVRQAGHIAVETLLPGYDERRPSTSAAAPPAGKLIEREQGALYEALWDQALADSPDWILISSFNQWHNGTEIEPSLEMGEMYLRRTKDYTTQFKRNVSP